jgi:MoxR-like ATPase
MNVDEASTSCQQVLDLLGEAVVADRTYFEELLVGILAQGHVLIEDVPGTGKTLTARTMAQLLGLEFNRIQFTPDLLPGDVTGTNVYREAESTFEFNPGPLFANVVLADEINRAPPKTQAALLEAMEERQVTVDGVTHDLPEPFFVIATQNPVEHEGTFRLPEAQIDRFLVKTSIGYPDADSEMHLLDRRGNRDTRTPTLDAEFPPDVVTSLRDVPESVAVRRRAQQYIVDLVQQTRSHEQIDVGVSPRGTQRLYEASRARAVLHGRDFVVPDDVKALTQPVLAHRLVLTTDAQVRGVEKRSVMAAIVDSTQVPKAEGAEREGGGDEEGAGRSAT